MGVVDSGADGINGHLAPGNPPTAEGFADAVVKCLTGPAEYARLVRGAVQMAHRFSMKNHLSSLLDIFERVAREGESSRAAAVVA